MNTAWIDTELEGCGIDFMDVGCGGELDPKWASIQCLLHYVGFDPNKEECQDLNGETSQLSPKTGFVLRGVQEITSEI